jgi:hypothetical protein
MADAKGDESADRKKEAGKDTPSLEIVFSSALAAFASLIKDSALRSIAAIAAPPVGYVLVKLGRWVITFWVPKWTVSKPETPESLTKAYIRDARKELKGKHLTPAERALKISHIQQLEVALQQHRLQRLQTVSPPPPVP